MSKPRLLLIRAAFGGFAQHAPLLGGGNLPKSPEAAQDEPVHEPAQRPSHNQHQEQVPHGCEIRHEAHHTKLTKGSLTSSGGADFWPGALRAPADRRRSRCRAPWLL